QLGELARTARVRVQFRNFGSYRHVPVVRQLRFGTPPYMGANREASTLQPRSRTPRSSVRACHGATCAAAAQPRPSLGVAAAHPVPCCHLSFVVFRCFLLVSTMFYFRLLCSIVFYELLFVIALTHVHGSRSRTSGKVLY